MQLKPAALNSPWEAGAVAAPSAADEVAVRRGEVAAGEAPFGAAPVLGVADALGAGPPQPTSSDVASAASTTWTMRGAMPAVRERIV